MNNTSNPQKMVEFTPIFFGYPSRQSHKIQQPIFAGMKDEKAEFYRAVGRAMESSMDR